MRELKVRRKCHGRVLGLVIRWWGIPSSDVRESRHKTMSTCDQSLKFGEGEKRKSKKLLV